MNSAALAYLAAGIGAGLCIIGAGGGIGKLARAVAAAQQVDLQHAEQGYTTNTSLEDLLSDDVVLASICFQMGDLRSPILNYRQGVLSITNKFWN